MMPRAEHSRVNNGRAAQGPRSRCWSPVFYLVLGLLLVACQPGAGQNGPQEEPIDTVDLPSEPPFEPENDPQARPRAAKLTGILPTGFPKDFPLYLPSSLVDFGTTARGGQTVTLLSPHAIGRVRPALQARLRAAGWVMSDASGEKLLRKEGRRAWLRFEDGESGTRYRIEYGI